MLDLRHLFGIAPELDTSTEWQRGPRIRAGELAMEPDSGIGEVFLASPRPVMTTEPPTLAGLYFVQIDAKSPRRVVEVYRERGRWMASWSDIDPIDVARSGYLFSRFPISEPR